MFTVVYFEVWFLNYRIAFSLSVVCLLSAAFSGFFLSIAGVMGKVCGSHNNFSELLENVIDNPETWSSSFSTHYPLSSVLLNMSQFPLKVATALDDCRANVSLFHAFHLEQRYDLRECIKLHSQEKVNAIFICLAHTCTRMHGVACT